MVLGTISESYLIGLMSINLAPSHPIYDLGGTRMEVVRVCSHAAL